MKTILIIHLVFAVLTFVVTFFVAFSALGRLRQKYAYMKAPKQSGAEKGLFFLRLAVIALLPIFNIIYCLVVIFNAESVIESTVNSSEKDLIASIERD